MIGTIGVWTPRSQVNQRRGRMENLVSSALSDMRAGLRMRPVWIALASEDIGDQHRRTTLGPLWLLINYLIFAGTFVVIFGQGGEPGYAAYVSIGLLVFLFLSEALTQSVSLFTREESFINGTILPLSVYVLRLSMQTVIRAGYAAVGCLGILLVNGTPVNAAWLWAVLSILLILLTLPAAILVVGVAGALFPDLRFIVANLMRLGMFLTPIFWVHSGEGGIRGLFYDWNPFTYFLEIVRIPILTGQMPWRALMVCVVIGICLWAGALLLLGKYRKQIVFLL